MDLILDVNTQIYPVDLGKVLDVWCISTFYAIVRRVLGMGVARVDLLVTR